MTDKKEFFAAFRENVTPYLKEVGFKGSAPRWVATNDFGDECIIGVEFDAGWEPPKALIEMAAVPKAWEEWMRGPYSSVSLETMTKRTMHYHGLILGTPKGAGVGRDGFWPIDDAHQSTVLMRDSLQNSLPRFMKEALDRDALLRKIRSGKFKPYGYLRNVPHLREVALIALFPSDDEADEARETLREFRGTPRWEKLISATLDWDSSRSESGD